MLKNFDLMFPRWVRKLLLVAAALFACIAFVRRRRLLVVPLVPVLALLALSLVPYVWYLAVSNHSWVHYWFTWRNQAVTVLCLWLAVCMVARPLFQTAKIPVSALKKGGELDGRF